MAPVIGQGARSICLMSILVRFPDGRAREVPSRTVEFKQARVRGLPLAPHDAPAHDPDWVFESVVAGQWCAHRRR
jgi:hypothetical protein